MEAAIIIAAIDGVSKIIDLIVKATTAAKQSGELTPAEEDALDAKLAELMKQPWWKNDQAA